MTGEGQLERLRAELARLVSGAGTGSADAKQFLELLGLFLAYIPDFMVLLAQDGTILFLNRARPGKTIAEVVGHNLFEYLPDDGGRMRTAIEAVFTTGKPMSLETSATYTDGSVHDFLTRIAPVFDGDRVVALASIATDVTAQKRVEAALRNSEEKLRVAVGATGMGLWSWDVKKDVVIWDDAMCRIWGISPDAVPRTRDAYFETIHPDDRRAHRDRIARVLETGTFPQADLRILRGDGAVRRTLSTASVVRAPDGSVEKLVGGVLDVTEQRELEERSRQVQKLEAIGQLSAGIAHNFNNMLTAILPNIELAMLDASPDSEDLLRAAREAGLRAAELVGQLTTFAGRARSSEKRVIDVRDLVERTVAICRRAFDPTIELSVRGPVQEEPVVSDPTQLEQALLNLLFNARDAVLGAKLGPRRVVVAVERAGARPENPALGLEARKRYVCIRVVDNGIGMNAETSRRIYEPFFTTKDVGKGTGLGLSTARTIVQEHGGILECTTSEGGGTTFSVFLPLADSDEPAKAPEAPGDETGGSQSIFVVDDEAPVRDIVRRMLERSGYTVHVAGGGREALEMLSNPSFRGSIDLVLLDLSMPEMSGTATRAAIRALAPRLKVAYFSGHAVDVPDDVVGVLEKPITLSVLTRRVREFLDLT